MPTDPMIPPPDTINPGAPQESPCIPTPPEGPGPCVPEFAPDAPDRYVPDEGAPETPWPGDETPSLRD